MLGKIQQLGETLDNTRRELETALGRGVGGGSSVCSCDPLTSSQIRNLKQDQKILMDGFQDLKALTQGLFGQSEEFKRTLAAIPPSIKKAVEALTEKQSKLESVATTNFLQLSTQVSENKKILQGWRVELEKRDTLWAQKFQAQTLENQTLRQKTEKLQKTVGELGGG